MIASLVVLRANEALLRLSELCMMRHGCLARGRLSVGDSSDCVSLQLF